MGSVAITVISEYKRDFRETERELRTIETDKTVQTQTSIRMNHVHT